MTRPRMPRRPRVPPPGWDELLPLIERRVAAGIRREEVASSLGMSETWLAKLERGGVPVVSSVHRDAYAAALDVLEAATP